MKNLNQTGDQTTVDVENNTKSPDDEGDFHNKVLETYHGSVYSLNEFEPKFYERNSCLRLTVGILKEMSDFKLLKENFAFALIVMSNFILFTGYFTPFLYITKVAEMNDIPKNRASLLISIIGIVNIPARMIYGFIADRRYIAPINLNTFSVLVATVPLFFYFTLQKTFITQIIFSIAFAIGIGKNTFFS